DCPGSEERLIVEGLTVGSRCRMQRLQNDHKAIMKEIDEALHSLHATGEKEKCTKDENEAQAEAMQHQHQQTLPGAFAKVDAVTPGSPASSSGVQVGDHIIAFGSVNTSNFQTMQNIASVVQHSEGNPLSVTVVQVQPKKKTNFSCVFGSIDAKLHIFLLLNRAVRVRVTFLGLWQTLSCCSL
uniref:26S proteasome non-ATPase regulatory subunit 9 n=1 Tax=Leptobrachium leishanense TaxID=445787 RepID=A0A8C5MJU1_9ANUR